VVVTRFDFGPHLCQQDTLTDPAQLDEPLADGAVCRWINVDGLTDMHWLAALSARYDLHPLAMEDTLHTSQRPKLERFGPPLPGRPRDFLVARMIFLREHGPSDEQVAVFFGPDTVLTLQERSGDVWDPLRHRLQTPGTKLRDHDAGFFVYALLDALIDGVFPVLERFSEELEDLEDSIIDSPDPEDLEALYQLRRALLLLRRDLWPTRDVVATLRAATVIDLGEPARTYLRDVADHAALALDTIDTSRELASQLVEVWLSASSQRMNSVMKTLSIIASIFIPLSFLAGVFGMNFDSVPGLHSPAAFVLFCLGCLSIGGGMLVYFWRNRWL
jgi:magnesium transporter